MKQIDNERKSFSVSYDAGMIEVLPITRDNVDNEVLDVHINNNIQRRT